MNFKNDFSFEILLSSDDFDFLVGASGSEIVTFFNPHELTKIILQSSTKFYGVKLNHLA